MVVCSESEELKRPMLIEDSILIARDDSKKMAVSIVDDCPMIATPKDVKSELAFAETLAIATKRNSNSVLLAMKG